MSLQNQIIFIVFTMIKDKEFISRYQIAKRLGVESKRVYRVIDTFLKDFENKNIKDLKNGY